jgi:RNA polymerase sporulation-specific sigma factor
VTTVSAIRESLPPDEARAEEAAAQVAMQIVDRDPAAMPTPLERALQAPGTERLPDPDVGCSCGCSETELLLRARAGNEDAVTDLLDRYRELARSKTRSYFLLGADRDDVVQEGMIGLYKAIRDYDETRGVPFRSFAEMCVTRQVVTAVRSGTRLKHAPLNSSVSLDQPVEVGSASASLGDLLPAARSSDPAATVVSAEEMRALQRHFEEVLSDLEQQVLRHHMEGKSYDEIAALLQRHVKAIDNALQRIKRKIQGHLESRDTGQA